MTESNENLLLMTFALFAYNQEQFIREAVEGALAQTYSPLQVILSDDCSSDRTFEIMQEMVTGYSGPHEILLNRNEQNLGIGGHVNRVMALAKGEFIVVAAGDDISYPNRCKVISEAIWRFPGTVAIGSGWKLIDAEGLSLPTKLPLHIRLGRYDISDDLDWIRKFQKNEPIGVPGCTAAWHHSLFLSFPKISSEVNAEDVVLVFRAYLTGSVVYLSDALISYRQHNNNICGTTSLAPEIAIEKDGQFAARSRKVFDQCISDVNSIKNNISLETFQRVIYLLVFYDKVAQIKAEWWFMPWHRRLWNFIRLWFQPNRVQFRYWLLKLLPRWAYIRFYEYRNAVRQQKLESLRTKN